MYTVYVIRSINFNKFYTGFTTDIGRRLNEHDSGKTTSNKAFKPFKLIYTEQVETRTDARVREKYLKSAAGRLYLKKKLAP